MSKHTPTEVAGFMALAEEFLARTRDAGSAEARGDTDDEIYKALSEQRN